MIIVKRHRTIAHQDRVYADGIESAVVAFWISEQIDDEFVVWGRERVFSREINIKVDELNWVYLQSPFQKWKKVERYLSSSGKEKCVCIEVFDKELFEHYLVEDIHFGIIHVHLCAKIIRQIFWQDVFDQVST